MGRRHRALPARRRRAGAVRAAGATTRRGVRRRVPRLARRDPPGRGDQDPARARPRRTSARCSSATARSCRACAQAAGGLDAIVFTGALPHDAMPAGARAADIGVAPFDVGAHAPLSLGFYWSPLKIFEYMAPACRSSRRAIDRLRGARRATGAKGCCTIPHDAGGAGAMRSRRLTRRRRCARRLGAAARERAVRDYSWAAHCAGARRGASARRARRARGRRDEDPHRRPTRSRPSAAAAAGARTSWRAACARAATTSRSSSRGRARPPASRETDYDGFRVLEFGAPAPAIPFVRNYFKNERLTRSLARVPGDAARARDAFDIVHAQHVLTTLPAIDAAQRRARSRRRHGARLLAGLLLVRPDLHTRERLDALPGAARPAT